MTTNGEIHAKWGFDDQLGAANEVSISVVQQAIDLVSAGRIYDLSQVIFPNSPRLSAMSPYSMCMWSHPFASRVAYESDGATNGVGFADERLETDLHIGTHIDALGHCWIGDSGYNGRQMTRTVTNTGLRELGIENVPPLITRGLLIDLAAARGKILAPGQVITPDDIQAVLDSKSLKVRAGDIVLLRTGWAKFYGVENATYVGDAPGLGVAGADFLAAEGAVVIGSDTMGLEVAPSEDTAQPWAVHQTLLAKHGVHILENANLDAIADDGIAQFMCICLADKIQGATASLVRLVAVI